MSGGKMAATLWRRFASSQFAIHVYINALTNSFDKGRAHHLAGHALDQGGMQCRTAAYGALRQGITAGPGAFGSIVTLEQKPNTLVTLDLCETRLQSMCSLFQNWPFSPIYTEGKRFPLIRHPWPLSARAENASHISVVFCVRSVAGIWLSGMESETSCLCGFDGCSSCTSPSKIPDQCRRLVRTSYRRYIHELARTDDAPLGDPDIAALLPDDSWLAERPTPPPRRGRQAPDDKPTPPSEDNDARRQSGDSSSGSSGRRRRVGVVSSGMGKREPTSSDDDSAIADWDDAEAALVARGCDAAGRRVKVYSFDSSDSGLADERNNPARRPSWPPDEPAGRTWRAPSVVVSDYSDDLSAGVAGWKYDAGGFGDADESDLSSAAASRTSSCSNLSALATLDAEWAQRVAGGRKASDCSSCSTLSGDEDCDSPLQTVRTRSKVSSLDQLKIPFYDAMHA